MSIRLAEHAGVLFNVHVRIAGGERWGVKAHADWVRNQPAHQPHHTPCLSHQILAVNLRHHATPGDARRLRSGTLRGMFVNTPRTLHSSDHACHAAAPTSVPRASYKP
jgi:hypothetical protein